jgi:hypothetical protein
MNALMKENPPQLIDEAAQVNDTAQEQDYPTIPDYIQSIQQALDSQIAYHQKASSIIKSH